MGEKGERQHRWMGAEARASRPTRSGSSNGSCSWRASWTVGSGNGGTDLWEIRISSTGGCGSRRGRRPSFASGAIGRCAEEDR